MKEVFLIRHAKSSWSNPDLQDYDRPLNNRGKRDAKMMSTLFAEKFNSIDLILTSTANRAIATTKAFTSDSLISYKEILKLDDLYHASAKHILKTIAKQDDQYSRIAVIGHNPGLTELANKIGNVNIDNLPTTGIIAFEFDIEKWENVLKKDGKMLFFDYPKKHKALKVK